MGTICRTDRPTKNADVDTELQNMYFTLNCFNKESRI